jgi:hypothetical protein
MGSVSAFFLLGSTHPFDGGLNPSFIIKLFEGDIPTWQAISIDDPDNIIEMDSESNSPDDIFRTGCRLVDLLSHNFGADSAGLVVFEGSSIVEPSANAEKWLVIKLLFTSKV